MNSDGDNPEGLGCPIRISTDQCLLAAPHGFSQPTTSFIASMRQGIHQMPFSYLDRLNSRITPRHAQRQTPPYPTGKKPNSTQTRTLQSERQTNTHTPRRPGYSHHFLSTMSKNNNRPRRDETLVPRSQHTAPCGTTPAPLSRLGIFASRRPFRVASPAATGKNGGADRDRTGDLKLAKLALSQLSYGPRQRTENRHQGSEGALRRCRRQARPTAGSPSDT